MQWQTWPASTASSNFIKRGERPDATTQIAGSIARAPFIAGEPIREVKLIKANGSGFMAAILPRACAPSRPKSRPRPAPAASSCPTTGSTSFFPSARRARIAPASADVVNSEIILSNVRVLAIDQAPKEKDGQNTVVGKTVTLELKPEQIGDARPRAPERHAVAGAAQHRRSQRNRQRNPTTRPRSGATASMWFATASQVRRRHRSDREGYAT